jgi:hypothetical protein
MLRESAPINGRQPAKCPHQIGLEQGGHLTQSHPRGTDYSSSRQNGERNIAGMNSSLGRDRSDDEIGIADVKHNNPRTLFSRGG